MVYKYWLIFVRGKFHRERRILVNVQRTRSGYLRDSAKLLALLEGCAMQSSGGTLKLVQPPTPHDSFKGPPVRRPLDQRRLAPAIVCDQTSRANQRQLRALIISNAFTHHLHCHRQLPTFSIVGLNKMTPSLTIDNSSCFLSQYIVTHPDQKLINSLQMIDLVSKFNQDKEYCYHRRENIQSSLFFVWPV